MSGSIFSPARRPTRALDSQDDAPARSAPSRRGHERPGLGRWLAPLAASLLALSACVPPLTPMQRLTDSAYDLNLATRFGRMDIALPYVSAEAQPQFVRHHAAWGNSVRVVDLDLVGIRAMGEDAVVVDLVVTWHPINDMMIRQSQISQRWKLERDDWRMVEEQRAGGDPGLFPGASAEPAKQARLVPSAAPPTLGE
jgi:hypothetical protein